MRTASGALNAYDYLQGMQHFTGTRCGRRVQFEAQLKAWTHGLPFSLKGVHQARSDLADAIGDFGSISTTVDEVHHRVLLAELDATLAAYQSHSLHAKTVLSDFEPSEEYLSSSAAKAISHYASRGLTVPTPDIFIVDVLPGPYASGQGSVLTTDADDLKRFGIPNGVYFTPKAVTPVFADYTIAHELIHFTLGEREPERFSDFFEEGVAEFVSVFDYTRQRFGAQVARNTMLIHRLTSAVGLQWDHYIDGTRACLSAVLAAGLPTLYTRIGQGRTALSALNPMVGRGRLDAGLTFDAVVDCAIETLLDYPRHMIVSGLAFHVANFCVEGATGVEIASQAHVSRELAEEALRQLENEMYLVRRPDGAVIEYAPVREYLSLGALRFDFSGE